MANINSVRERSTNFFRRSADISTDGSAVEFADATSSPPFSPFDPDDMARVAEVLGELDGIMHNTADPVDGLDAVMDRLDRVALSDSLALAQHAHAIFVVHANKSFRNAPALVLPPLALRSGARPAGGDIPMVEDDTPAAPLTGEDLMHWFREDLFLNEHHLHWHIVYPTSGVRIENSPNVRMKDRQGEIFVYMHQQMLARYDTERVAAGLDKVDPLTDISASLGDGYDPNARPPADIGYVERGDDLTISSFAANDLTDRRNQFLQVLETSEIFGQQVDLNANMVGALLESNLGVFGGGTLSATEQNAIGTSLRNNYHLHNFGHGAIASVPNNANRVMNHPHTSLQDPVFWRWHRMIDDLAERFYGALPAHTIDPGIGIKLRNNLEDEATGAASPDVIMVAETRLRDEGIDLNADDRDDAIDDYVTQHFGEALWDQAPEETATSSELLTGVHREAFVYDREVFNPVTGVTSRHELDFEREHLFSERFFWVVRAENDGPERLATLRLFIAADSFLDLDDANPDAAKRAEEHRFWIEMERAPVQVAPGRNVFWRASDQSSIVRKLQGRAPWPTSSFSEEDFGDLLVQRGPEDDFCDCGWPLNLSIPKGTNSGMAFHAMAVVSKGAPDGGVGACGSRAFCGTGFDSYPELPDINMGYPFDRPAPGGTLSMIQNSSNMALRRFTIRHDLGLGARFGLAPIL